MIHAQNTKKTIVIIPQSIGTSAVTGTIDTLGYEHCTIDYALDTAAASSVITTMSVTEGDGTSFTAIASLTGGTATSNFTLPVPNTSTPDLVTMHIDLRGRKRNLKVNLASTTARLCSVTATLSRGGVAPTTAAEAGVSTLVIV